jgi:hypothetical protein
MGDGYEAMELTSRLPRHQPSIDQRREVALRQARILSDRVLAEQQRTLATARCARLLQRLLNELGIPQQAPDG